MSTPDILAATTPVVEALDRLAVPYSVVGSVASSAHGLARATLDVDLVADLKAQHAQPLADTLSSAYYVDADAVHDAVKRRAMFNVVHLETMLKIDIYVLSARPFDQESFRRRQKATLEESKEARSFSLDTPEDTVLHKLEWYRAGHEVSDRQWGDIVGVLRVQADALDFDYMLRWATELAVDDLLERARREATPSSD